MKVTSTPQEGLGKRWAQVPTIAYKGGGGLDRLVGGRGWPRILTVGTGPSEMDLGAT